MKHKKKDAYSTLTVRQLGALRSRLARQLPDTRLNLKGSLQTQSRRCGKEGCDCLAGELHGPYVYLAVRSGRRVQLVYIAEHLAKEVKRRVEVTERIEKILKEISAVNLELLRRGELN